MKLNYLVISLIIVVSTFSSCRVKKNSHTVVENRVVQAKELYSNTWLKQENLIVNTEDSTRIDFNGVTEVFITSDGNISFKGESPTITKKTKRSEQINILDTGSIYVEKELLVIDEKKEVVKSVERTAIPLWVYAVLILVVIVFGLYRYLYRR